jgi:hypothetical protein
MSSPSGEFPSRTLSAKTYHRSHASRGGITAAIRYGEVFYAPLGSRYPALRIAAHVGEGEHGDGGAGRAAQGRARQFMNSIRRRAGVRRRFDPSAWVSTIPTKRMPLRGTVRMLVSVESDTIRPSPDRSDEIILADDALAVFAPKEVEHCRSRVALVQASLAPPGSAWLGHRSTAGTVVYTALVPLLAGSKRGCGRYPAKSRWYLAQAVTNCIVSSDARTTVAGRSHGG